VTGKVVRKLLGRTDASPIAHDENEYMKNLKAQPTHGRAGEITLFGDK
jgi:hypothetical protein